jgi:hypothetical protein
MGPRPAGRSRQQQSPQTRTDRGPEDPGRYINPSGRRPDEVWPQCQRRPSLAEQAGQGPQPVWAWSF